MFPNRRELLHRLFLFISSLFFLLLNAYTTRKIKLCLLAAAASVFAIILFFDPYVKKCKNPERKYITSGLVIAIVMSVGFFCCWSESASGSLIQGMPGYFLLIAFSAVAALLSVPFLAVACKWLWESGERDIICRSDGFLSSSKMFYVYVFIALLGFASLILCSHNASLWYDEVYSMEIVRLTYGEMVAKTALDVHPPLYYAILKFVTEAVCSVFPTLSVIWIAKLVSVTPFFFMLLICFTYIRKTKGQFVAGVWAVTLTGMPNLIHYGVEIRMYSWAMLFVVLSFVFVDNVVCKGRFRDWCGFVATSLCAAYTHYYACVAVAFYYLLLLIWFCTNNRKKIRNWVLAALATVIGYLPWLRIFLLQAIRVSQDYWINSLDIRIVFDCLEFIFGLILPAVVFCIYVGLTVKKTMDQRGEGGNWNDALMLTGALSVIGVAIVGIAMSILLRPIFITRYLLVAMPCLWLGFLMMMNTQQRLRSLKVFVVCIMLTVSLMNVYMFSKREYSTEIQNEQALAFYAEHPNAVFFSDKNGIECVIHYISGNECYHWTGNVVSKERVFEVRSFEKLTSVEDIERLLDAREEVIYATKQGEEAIKEILEDSDLKYTDLGAYHGESRMEFYQITRN